jgi:EmrB/QacA subfamily drug resistance transporter
LTDEHVYSRRYWTLGVLCLSLLITFMGNTSLNVAIPALSRELHASTSQLQWAVTSYSLVFAGLLFTTGALSDRFGRKGALQLGLVGYVVMATLATLSTEMWQLIACRALMGACAALIMPATLSILVNVFPPEERPKAIGIWSGVTGAAGSLGQVFTGWLVTHFWYGSVFLATIPMIVVALVAGFLLVPTSRDPNQTRLDPTGALLSIVGIGSVVFALIEGPEQGWTGPTSLGALVLGTSSLVAFVLWERRVEFPMLDMSFFRNRAFTTGTAGMILVFAALHGVNFLLSQFFQLVLDYSPLSAAARFLPFAPIMMVVAYNAPWVVARIGAHRAVSAGMALLSIGFVLMLGFDTGTSYGFVLFAITFQVVGASLAISPMTGAIMSAVPPDRAGVGSAMNDTSRELGTTLGVAMLGAIAASTFSRDVVDAVSGLSPADAAVARTSLGAALETAQHLPAAAAARLTDAAQSAFMNGMHVAAIGGAILCAVASLAVLRFLPTTIAHRGAMKNGLQSAENAAELTLGGTPPLFADTADDQVHS